MKDQSNKKAVLTGVLAALAASSCCIPPVIAALAGVGGLGSSLSWIEPFRPYLIGLAIIAIGYAWYSNLKPKKEDDCGCAIEKPKWFQTKLFLIGMTLFAAISISFPYYSGVFFKSNSPSKFQVNKGSQLEEVILNIDGMTCAGCEHHVNATANKLKGVQKSDASYKKGEALITFDKSIVTLKEIEKAIEEATGYTITDYKKKNNE